MRLNMLTRKSCKRVLIALFISLACTMPASAEIYRCTVGGRSVFQDKPCDAQAKQEIRSVRGGNTGGGSSFAGCYFIPFIQSESGRHDRNGVIRIFRQGPQWFMSLLENEGGPNAHNARVREAEPQDFQRIQDVSGIRTSSAIVGSGTASNFMLFRSGVNLYSRWGTQVGVANLVSCAKGAR